MITSERLLPLQPDLPSHEWHDLRDECIWCGMTRQDIVEFGEDTCVRRERYLTECR